MRCNILLYAIVIVTFATTTSRWCVVAREVREFAMLLDRTLQDPNNDDSCEYVCEEIDQQLPLDELRVTEVQPENDSVIGRMINRVNGFFNSGRKFGDFMNRFLNLLQGRQSNKRKYVINTDFFSTALSNYSTKVKSLAALIRSESVVHSTVSDSSDVITTIFALSAENMELVASVIDPIINEMHQLDMMDLTALSCLIEQLLTYIRDETLPNILSISKHIYTSSGGETTKNSYNESVTVSPASALASAFPQNVKLDQCGELASSNIIPKTTIRSSIPSVDQVDEIPTPESLIGLIVIFPISIVVSIVTLVFVGFYVIFSKIFNRPLLPNSNCTEPFCSLPQGIGVLIIFLLIASPILIIFQIVSTIIQFLSASPSTAAPSTQIQNDLDEPSRDVMQHLLIVLESPMEYMVDSLLQFNESAKTEDDKLKLNCETKTILCQNEALLAALPF